MKKITLVALFYLLLAGTACTSLKKGNTASKEQGTAGMALEGTWVLDLLPVSTGGIDSLYGAKKPELSFEPAAKRFSGYTGCNRINGPLTGTGNNISFRGDIAMTQMACSGEGETLFLENLKKTNRYSVSSDGRTLTMIQGDIALLRFHKR